MLVSALFLASSCIGAEAISRVYVADDSINDVDSSFAAFLQEHGRSYKPGSDEYVSRRERFKERSAMIKQHNRNPNKLWTAAVNKFADRTTEELSKRHGFNRRAKTTQHNVVAKFARDWSVKDPLPHSVSYTNLTAMQDDEVMDQGQCGSCWAAAAAVTLRAHSELYHTDTKYSAQELVSCSPNAKHCGGTGGCAGSTGELAFEYVMNHGLSTEAEQPYLGKDSKCPSKSKSSGSSMGMSGWSQLPSNKVEPLQRALVDKGPVAVSVAADDYWFFYSSGIMDSCTTTDPIINHLVVLIGYGNEDGKGFWELQNSWGTSWGAGGKMRLLRSDDEESFCGMDDKPQDGVACEGEDDPVKVCGNCGILYDAVVPDMMGKKKTDILQKLGAASAEKAHRATSTSGGGGVLAEIKNLLP